MKHGVGELELVDSEAKHIKTSKFFQKTNSGNYVLDMDTATKKLKSLGLTRAQMEIYVYWNHIFSDEKLYSSKNERGRRIALVIWGDAKKAGNVLKTLNKIDVKIGEE